MTSTALFQMGNQRLTVAEVFGVEVGAGLGTGVRGQDHTLAGEFEAFATANIAAGDHFVDANHIGARVFKALAVFGTGAAWEFVLLGAHHPANGIGAFLLAMRADQGEVFGLLALDIKLSLVHSVTPDTEKPRF